MATRPRLRVLTALLACSVAIACGDGADPKGPSAAELRDVVAVTSGPTALLVRWVAPDATIEAVIPAGVAPGGWAPDDAALEALVSARAVVTIGDQEFEPWTQRVALPPSRTVEAGAKLPDGATITVGTIEHTHGDGPAHSHGGRVATYWTDPDLLGPLAEATAAGLARAGVEGARVPPGPAPPWAGAVEEYRAALLELGTAAGGRALLASDHGLEYVARAAGVTLRVALLECDAEGPTNQRGVLQLDEFARRSDASGLLVVFSAKEAEAARAVAAEFGATPHVFDSGVAYDPARDALGRLTASVRALTAALRETNR